MAIAGGGIGGLSTAIRLASAGYRVTVLEKQPTVGGRANTLDAEGFHFDTGPTLLLMPDVYEELFAAAGRNIHDYLDMRRMDTNYRVFFDDGLQFDMTTDLDALGDTIEGIEPGGKEGLRRYLEQAGLNYRVSREKFVERNFLSAKEFFTPANLGMLRETRALNKLFKDAGRYFADDRLKLAFTFQSMYLGNSPVDSLAIYSLLPYTELAQGIWYPMGGIYSLVSAMVKLAGELGVEIRTGCGVAGMEVDGREVTGLRLDSGELVTADIYLSNVDLPTTYNRLVPQGSRGAYTTSKLKSMQYTASAFMLYLGVNRTYPELGHHNVLFASDWKANFDTIFGDERSLPETPSLYVNLSTRTDPSVAPDGSEAVYVLVPVSNLEADIDWQKEAPDFRDLIIRRLEATIMPGLSEHIVFEQQKTPLDWLREYGLARGAAFGLSHGFRQVGFFRPQNKASKLDNLYFVGASTVPGTGVPMVIIGSRLVSQRILNDWGPSA